MKIKILFLALLVSAVSWGQYAITGVGSGNTYTQNFDAFRGTAVTLPTNWAVTTASYNATYPILTSGAASPTVANASGNNCYAGRASSASSDYSILQKQATSGSTTFVFSATNSTGANIDGFVITWNVEQFSSQGRATTVDFSYRIGAGAYSTTGVSGTTLYTSTTGSSTTFSVVQTGYSITVTGLTIAAGSTVDFKYSVANGPSSGSNAHVGIDDFTMYATGTPPAIPVVTASTFSGTVGTAFSNSIVATNSPTSYAIANATSLPAGLSLNTTTGAITGTPTAAGTFTTDVTATNGAGTSAIVTLTFNIASPPVPVVTASTFSGTVGTAFSNTIVATNSPTSYAITSGTLPAGLSFNTTTGAITGTPTAGGSSTINVTTTNAGGTSAAATITFNIAVVIAPVVTGASLSGTVGSAFTYTISATNSPTSYALASGTLPTGLSLNTTTGVISGTPTASGSFSVTVTATNAGGTSPAATISFTIISTACVTQGFASGTTPPSGWIFTGITGTYSSAGNYGLASPSLSMDSTNDVITTEVLPTGNAASQLSFWFKGQGINTGSTSTLQVDGYDGTSWTNIEVISSATLISSSSAAITRTYNSGSTPVLNSGYVRFRLTYKKDVGNIAIDDIGVNCTTTTVNPPVVTAATETATVSSAYSYYVVATNFPTSYAITSGTLPAGLSFNTATGQISGAPTSTGSYAIDVTATNSGGTSASATISFTIVSYVAGCYTVNFDDGSTKASYVADDVSLNGKLWNLSETLVGGLSNDFGTGTYALRMKSSYDAAATMIQDKPNGIGTISFDYKKYGTDTYIDQVFNVEYSKDSGNTWIYIGNVVPSSSTINTFSATVNQSGPIRVRIVFASGTESGLSFRFNVDNLSICDYLNTKEIEVFGNATTIANNSVAVSVTNNTYFSPNYFVGDTPIVKTFVVTNNGTGTLNLSSLSISASTFYTITSGLSSSTLTAGQSATFTITFSSNFTGLKNATVTINSDDADEGAFNFLISTLVFNYTKCTLLPPSYIAQQDFDSNVSYTYTTGTSNLNTSIAGGTNYGDNRSSKTSMFLGSNSLQSFNNLNTFTFATLNTQSYQNIEFSFNMGAYGTTTSDGMETSDYVLISTSIDGGVTYYPQLKITGNANSIFDINNALSTNIAVYKVNSTNPTRFGTLTSSTNTTASTFKITGLPNVADLRIKVSILSNKALEIWAIDNIAVKGQLPLTTTWDGTTWNPSAPTSSTKAIIDGYYDTTTNGGSVQACECTINGGNTFNVSAGDYLEVQSNLTTNGTLNVANNGSLVQLNDEAVNTNNGVTSIARRTSPFKKYDYTYWSSPVENATISSTFIGWRTDYSFQFTTANFSDTLTINNAGAVTASSPDGFDDYSPWAWQNYTGAMTVGKGYAIMGPTTLTFSPTATTSVTFSGKQNNGIISLPLTLSGNSGNANDDFNLIGNPYPSSIFGDTFINLNPDISGTLYFWTHNVAISTSNPGPDVYNFITSDYAMYNLSGGVASATGSSQPTGYIASGEGFFIEAINANSALFNNSMRGKTYNNSNFYKHTSNQGQTNEIARSRIWLNLQNPDGMFSQQLIAYNNNATLGFDKGYDGAVNVSRNYVSFYSFIDMDKYRIQTRSGFSLDDMVPLGFFTASTGNYSISLADFDGVFQNENIYLQDNELNIIHDLKQAPYTFTSNYGTFDTRFVLRYTNEALSNPSFDSIANSVVASANHGQLTVKSYVEKMKDITVFDLLGRQLFEAKNLDSNDYSSATISAVQQALIVKITLDNGTVVTKKIIL